MKIRGQEVLIPTSMVGNYPNPRWWDAEFARHFTGDQEPPDSHAREALEDVIAAIASDQENAGLDIIADGRVHGDNYADAALYYYFRRLGYNLKGGHLGFPIYSRLHAGTVTQEIKRRGAIMVEQARALKTATNKPTKVQYTGIQVLAQCTNDLYYDNPRATVPWRSPRRSTRTSSKSTPSGVDFIQLDEFTWPYFYEDWAIEAFNRAVEGVQERQDHRPRVLGQLGRHAGLLAGRNRQGGRNLRSHQAQGRGALGDRSVVPKSYEAQIDVLNLESCGRRGDDMCGLERPRRPTRCPETSPSGPVSSTSRAPSPRPRNR